MKKMLILLAVVAGVAGCTNAEKGATVGGLGGAAIGAAVAGDAGGAIIGGIAGAAAGALIGNATEPGYCVYRERNYPHRKYKARC